MDTAEILKRFERLDGKFELAAVEAAVARREEITPELLRILEETVDRAAELRVQNDYMAHLYAMFLLAQFRETRAYPLVVRLASLPEDLLDSLWGGFGAEHLHRILASVCGGELDGIRSLIENEDVDQWVRGAALASLVCLVGAGQQRRDEIVSYLARLFRGGLARQYSNVWDTLVASSTDLYPAELLGDIEQAYNEGLVDTSVISLDDVKRDLSMGKDRVLARLAGGSHLVEDTVEEMEWWPCFQEHVSSPARDLSRAERTPLPLPAFAPPMAASEPLMAAPAQIRREQPKVGRNEPCPCGSGKKYKKCCGA